MQLGGDDDLEVVGESQYQQELWAVAGRRPGERVRVEVVAQLHAELDNPHDENAISVWISGLTLAVHDPWRVEGL